MSTRDEKIRRLKSLSRLEMEVLYYFGQGMTDDEICEKLGGITLKTLITRRTGIYRALGIDAPDREKQNILAQEYSPLIPEVCASELALKRWRPIKSDQDGNIQGGTAKKRQETRSNPLLIPLLVTLGALGYFVYRQFIVPGSPPVQESMPLVFPTASLASSPLPAEINPDSSPAPLPMSGDAAAAPSPVPATALPTQTSLPTETPFVPPADGILFQDNFDNGWKSDWKLGDDWITADGELSQSTQVTDRYYYSWATLDRPEWKNYILSVKINIPYMGSGAQSKVAVAVRLNNQAKYLGVQILPFVGNALFFIGTSSGDSDAVAKSRVFDFDSGSTLQIEANGNTFTVSINGRQAQQVSVSGYDSGGIGLGIDCTSVLGCPSFDDVKVTYLP